MLNWRGYGPRALIAKKNKVLWNNETMCLDCHARQSYWIRPIPFITLFCISIPHIHVYRTSTLINTTFEDTMGFFYTLDHAIKGELLSQPKPCKAEQADKGTFYPMEWFFNEIRWNNALFRHDFLSTKNTCRRSNATMITDVDMTLTGNVYHQDEHAWSEMVITVSLYTTLHLIKWPTA